MSHGWDGTVSAEQWRARLDALPDRVRAALHAHAPLPEPPPDASNLTAVAWAVIAAEAALGADGQG